MSKSEPPVYQVLARKYRPASFADLIGQDTMVRTLQNAFESDRIAHAFILTGVRGVGKTTTARIIAKGLNCIGADGAGGATISPCGVCEQCVSIAAGRHVDVLEMDAASRTGVDNIREIIESVHYRAASARYKIYIIDEVHMLSTSAFNALLKTLEEPPAHVKFIFATTEIRKIPITVMSRCQRFDLRRIEGGVMREFLQKIAGLESAKIEDDALALLIRAAEGSVRDALSLLDQAIAHSHADIKAAQLREMLGFADRGRTLDLFDFIMRGDAAAALGELAEQAGGGADPIAVLSDLAEVTHWISVVKISPEAAQDPTISPDVRDRGRTAAEALPMRALARMWQMVLQALKEVRDAPNALMAAEMTIIRLTHIADLPSPDEIIGLLKAQGEGQSGGQSDAKNEGQDKAVANAPSAAPQAGSSSDASAQPTPAAPETDSTPAPAPTSQASNVTSIQGTIGNEQTSGNTALEVAPEPEPESQPAPDPDPIPATASDPLAHFTDFAQVVALIRENNDIPLLYEVETHLHLVSYKPGRIEFEPSASAKKDLAQQLSQRLRQWTGARWGVSVVASGGGKTLAEQASAQQSDLREQVKTHPIVAAALGAFDGAQVVKVHRPEDGFYDAATKKDSPTDSADSTDATAPPPDSSDEDPLEDNWQAFE